MCPGRRYPPLWLFFCESLCVSISKGTHKKEKLQKLRVLQRRRNRKYVSWSSMSVALDVPLCNCVCACFQGHAVDGVAVEAGTEA